MSLPTKFLVALAALALSLSGCGRKSSLLLERHALGPIEEAGLVGHRIERHLEPVPQTQLQADIEVTVQHAPQAYLEEFFKNEKLFGSYAGRNPYYLENLVFYIKIANRSDAKIFVDPVRFALVDDQGNQYRTIGIDYVTALAESRQPVATATRGMLEGASPGYFGFSVPVGKLFAGKPQWQFALIKQSSLQPGVYQPGVVHDGLIAFWNPATNATTLRLFVGDIKTDFDPNDLPQSSLDFVFEFQMLQPSERPPAGS